jgi:hypothetical protein
MLPGSARRAEAERLTMEAEIAIGAAEAALDRLLGTPHCPVCAGAPTPMIRAGWRPVFRGGGMHVAVHRCPRCGRDDAAGWAWTPEALSIEPST